MDKYIVKYVRSTESKHVSTTVEMSREEAKELYEADKEYYMNQSKLNPYKSITFCKVEYTDIETVNL